MAGAADDKPEITRPYATAQDSIGRLLVADPGQKGVHIYDFEKHKYQFLKGPRGRSSIRRSTWPAIPMTTFTSATRSRAAGIRFRLARAVSAPIGGSGGGADAAADRDGARPRSAAAVHHGHAAAPGAGLGHGRTLIRAIGRRGTGPGEFNFPTALTLSAARLYVVDAMNFRVQAFTPEGRFVNSFGQLGDQTGTLNRPKGIAADTDGNLYLVDALFETVQVFDPAGAAAVLLRFDRREAGTIPASRGDFHHQPEHHLCRRFAQPAGPGVPLHEAGRNETGCRSGLLAALPLSATSSKTALIGSQHDLTATGGGPVKSAQADTCIFCHAPHNVSPNVTPLWDHTLSSQTYTTYTQQT